MIVACYSSIYCILNYVHMASVDLRRYECVGVLKEQTHELSHDKYIPTYCLRYNTPASNYMKEACMQSQRRNPPQIVVSLHRTSCTRWSDMGTDT